jgi:malonyl-CoA O-methyltransferase
MRNVPGAFALDFHWARRSFDRAADSYDEAAVLHTQVCEQHLARLELTSLAPQVVLDAGAGTGHGTRALRKRYPKSVVIALDFSEGMLRTARRQREWLRPFERVCAAAERLPFKEGSVDLIFSNLLLQWCDPERLFPEMRRVLKPNGLFTFTSFGPDTLRELRGAWAQADGGAHVLPFIDMHDLGDALGRHGFAAPVLDVERFTLFYQSVNGVLADLKATGARNALADRARGLTGPRKMERMRTAYEQFRDQGRLPATYEVVFGHAWAPAAPPPRTAANGATFSLQEMQQQLKKPRAR